MFKWFNKKKKDNKGFTLVELVIVVAILAILVGILAPQYTKYVEKSRKSADVSNLENIVQGFKVAAADQDYNINADTYKIEISSTGTKITPDSGALDSNLITALKEYTGYTFSKDDEVTQIKLKSKKWTGTNDWTDTTLASGKSINDGSIGAVVKIDEDGSVQVSYCPKAVAEIGNAKAATSPEAQNPGTGS